MIFVLNECLKPISITMTQLKLITEILTSNSVVTMLTWEDRCEAIYIMWWERSYLCGHNRHTSVPVLTLSHFYILRWQDRHITSHHRHNIILQRHWLLHLLILRPRYIIHKKQKDIFRIFICIIQFNILIVIGLQLTNCVFKKRNNRQLFFLSDRDGIWYWDIFVRDTRK